MPIARVQLPDGRIGRFDVPEGTTAQQAESLASKYLASQESAKAEFDPTVGMSQVERFNAGMGKAFHDLGTGAAQLVGLGPGKEAVQENRRLSAPLMRTGAGFSGNLAGNVAALSPLALLPGAGTVLGAGALGATVAGLSPTASTTERLGNMGLGFVLGAGSQWAGTTGATLLGERAARQEAAAQTAKAQNAVRDATLEEARRAGYVVPPSAVNPSFVNKRLESIAGKAAVGQQAAIQNQQVTNSLARSELGMSASASLSEEGLAAARKNAGQPYAEVAALSPKATTDLEALKQARFDANAYYKHYGRSADPNSLKLANTASGQAKQLEQSLENEARNAGRPDLIDALRNARMQIAKNYTVDRALNVATGDVSARALGSAMDKGVPVSGGLKTAAKFGEAFSPYAREGTAIPTPGVSKLEALSSLALGLGGYGVAGPFGTAAAALPLLSGPTRSLVLSPAYQRAMATPSYSPGLLSTLAQRGLLPSAQTGGLLGRQAIPAFLTYEAAQ